MPSLPDDRVELSEGSAGRPPRSPTFLARYQRKFKISVALIALVAIVVGPTLVHGVSSLLFHHGHKKATGTIVSSADRNQEVASAPVVKEESDDDQPVAEATDKQPVMNAIALNDQDDRTIKLAPAPFPGLSQEAPEGSLPRIGEDGREPWQAYARPFNSADQRPRIALVIMDIGLSQLSSEAAINRLPGNVTMAIDAQTPTVGVWSTRARQAGHETILALPMEPFDYPRSDPGPRTLLSSLSNSDNIVRLLGMMREASGYIGVTSFSGSRFTTDPEKLTPVLEELQHRGLMILDAHVAPHSVVTDLAHGMHLPVATSSVVIDLDPAPAAIEAALSQLEQTARVNGLAVAIASPYPSTLDRLDVWLKGLPQRGIALAPLSVMVK